MYFEESDKFYQSYKYCFFVLLLVPPLEMLHEKQPHHDDIPNLTAANKCNVFITVTYLLLQVLFFF